MRMLRRIFIAWAVLGVAALHAAPVARSLVRMAGTGRPIVLERKAVEEARGRILSRYGVTREQNL